MNGPSRFSDGTPRWHRVPLSDVLPAPLARALSREGLHGLGALDRWMHHGHDLAAVRWPKGAAGAVAVLDALRAWWGREMAGCEAPSWLGGGDGG